MSLMRRSSSIKRRVSRHTRNLLRQYAQEGRLSQSVSTAGRAFGSSKNERDGTGTVRRYPEDGSRMLSGGAPTSTAKHWAS